MCRVRRHGRESRGGREEAGAGREGRPGDSVGGDWRLGLKRQMEGFRTQDKGATAPPEPRIWNQPGNGRGWTAAPHRGRWVGGRL